MKLNTYQKWALTTICSTILLILIGSLVRVTGAGLGCPDWPRCFGMWIPPTTLSELPTQFDASQFNPILTWIEYINRLVGVLIGIFIFITLVLSVKVRKTTPSVFFASLVAFILVVFQGWLGKIVVETGLHEGMITIHMVMALIIVCVFCMQYFKVLKGI